MRVLIAVTHLLGAGHLTRAAALARAFSAAGHEAVLVSGGMPAPLVRLDGVRLVQLPPVRVRGTAFTDLLDADGSAASPALHAARRRALLGALVESAPDAVVTELFPFGRRALAEEFLMLVEAVRARRPRPLVVASVRDILVAPDKPEKVAVAHERIARLYDAVLVHGDPALVPLDASWPVDAGLGPKLRYTGYVDEGGPVAPAERSGIVVAAGSSAAGLGMLHAAAQAARRRPDLGWRILAGYGVPDADFFAMGEGLAEGVLTRARPDYRALLAGAAVSVSQCGYNTAVDLLAAGPRAVLVPFEAGRETEQRLRAERLAARGLARVVAEATLTPDRLLDAVLAASAGPLPNPSRIDRDGAARSVTIVEGLAGSAPLGRRGRPEGTVVSGEARVPSPVRERDRVRGATFPEKAFPSPQPSPGRERGRVALPVRDGPTYGARSAFARLSATLDAAAARGERLSVWWRDDDAVAATPALDRLLALADAHAAPILLAAIPAKVEPSLGRRVAQAPGARLAVHGLAHVNHAPAEAKPAEFGPHRPLSVLLAEAAEGLRLSRERLPHETLLPVFVPPWNRLAPGLAAALPSLGYAGLSAAPGPAIPGLIRADAHLDPIDWHGTRSLADPDALIDGLIRTITAGPSRPLGLLTHHLAHDDAVWAFVADLVALLSNHAVVTCLDPRHLFGLAADAATRARPISLKDPRARAS